MTEETEYLYFVLQEIKEKKKHNNHFWKQTKAKEVLVNLAGADFTRMMAEAFPTIQWKHLQTTIVPVFFFFAKVCNIIAAIDIPVLFCFLSQVGGLWALLRSRAGSLQRTSTHTAAPGTIWSWVPPKPGRVRDHTFDKLPPPTKTYTYTHSHSVLQPHTVAALVCSCWSNFDPGTKRSRVAATWPQPALSDQVWRGRCERQPLCDCHHKQMFSVEEIQGLRKQQAAQAQQWWAAQWSSVHCGWGK